MNKFLLALILVLVKFSFTSLTSMPWSIFDPLLALVVIYTFFHGFDTKYYLIYAFFCGFLSDVLSLDAFGIYIFSYCACALGTAIVSRIIYRHNWIFVFPIVFASAFVSNQLILIFKVYFFGNTYGFSFGLFIIKAFVESLGSALLAYLLYLFSKRCASGLIG